jgi:hypothetical protein
MSGKRTTATLDTGDAVVQPTEHQGQQIAGRGLLLGDQDGKPARGESFRHFASGAHFNHRF